MRSAYVEGSVDGVTSGLGAGAGPGSGSGVEGLGSVVVPPLDGVSPGTPDRSQSFRMFSRLSSVQSFAESIVPSCTEVVPCSVHRISMSFAARQFVAGALVVMNLVKPASRANRPCAFFAESVSNAQAESTIESASKFLRCVSPATVLVSAPSLNESATRPSTRQWSIVFSASTSFPRRCRRRPSCRTS